VKPPALNYREYCILSPTQGHTSTLVFVERFLVDATLNGAVSLFDECCEAQDGWLVIAVPDYSPVVRTDHA
jgi:hypothetical protein